MNNFERRIRSFSIDMSFATILFILLAVSFNTMGIQDNQLKLFLSATIAYFGVLIVPNFFSRGQSFGKRTQKMKVVYNDSEKVPSLIMLILREIVKGLLLLSTFGFYLVVCGIMVNSRKDGRGIHDLIFKTKVICITKYVSDKEEGYVLGQGESVKKHLEGSSYD
ncbi:MAG: RDD family protein [Candidatus Izemoplasmatales bacterium]|nr:RDD family protein [Candidatus Izemoplasmatales bacterium]